MFLSFLLAGIMRGSIYALLATGFVIVYKSTHVFNLALGELLLLGGFLGWQAYVHLHCPLWLTIIIVIVGLGLGGLTINQVVMRHFIGESPLAAIMVTLGLAAILYGVSTGIWQESIYIMPSLVAREPIDFGGASISWEHLLTFLVAAFLIALLALFFKYTRPGLAMRATAEDHQAAQSTGIKVSQIFSIAWIIAGIVCGLAGLFLGGLTSVGVSLRDLGLVSIPVVLLGGLESFVGAIIAGLIIGLAETFSIGYLDPLLPISGIAGVLPFIMAVLILIFRPYGLFGLSQIERV